MNEEKFKKLKTKTNIANSFELPQGQTNTLNFTTQLGNLDCTVSWFGRANEKPEVAGARKRFVIRYYQHVKRNRVLASIAFCYLSV